MLKLVIKILIILLSITIMPKALTEIPTFIFFLIAIAITALNQYYNRKKITLLLIISYTITTFFYQPALLFLPALFFDLVSHFSYKYVFFFSLVFFIPNQDLQITFFLVFSSLISTILAHLLVRTAFLDLENKEIRDTNGQQKIILTRKNQQLLEQQKDVLHLTKLQERNRIARDIHDTIGHFLSRALLQTGALLATNQDEFMQPAINDLKETLTRSMNAIRNSIHDLKDDAVDLKSAISQILDESGFKTSFTYDISEETPNNIKNCLLVVLKETITNTRKHSDSTQLAVRLIEHPAIYQFLIVDNGSIAPAKKTHGIGLQNIQERVAELNGYCRISYDSGFKTFITIPKKEPKDQ